MKTAARAVLVAGTLLSAAPALAQYYPNTSNPPPPPPPQYTPPPPPPPAYYPPPQPVYYQPAPVESPKPQITIRASGGVAFVGAGYYCAYYYTYYFASYSCGTGYATAFPDVNLDVDVWFKPTMGVTLGANVMWGTYTPYGSYYGSGSGVPTYTTIWEPHLDFLIAPPYSDQVKGRVRLGFGLYIANINNGQPTTTTAYAYNGVGGAFRIGFGASFLPKSKVGIGIDAIFEAGWIGSQYVSTIQLLIGPEINIF